MNAWLIITRTTYYETVETVCFGVKELVSVPRYTWIEQHIYYFIEVFWDDSLYYSVSLEAVFEVGNVYKC